MNAQQLIHEWQALPQEEQQKVANFFRETPAVYGETTIHRGREKSEALMDQVLKDHSELFRKLAH